MTKRISITLSDAEYSAVVQAVGVIITTTGTSTNVTQYIRDAITGAVCRDLKLNQLSDFVAVKDCANPSATSSPAGSKE